MNSEELKLDDLKTISPGQLYLLPDNFPGGCLDDHVRILHVYRATKPSGQEIADHIIKLAQALSSANESLDSAVLDEILVYDLDLISKMREFEPKVVKTLASGEQWVRDHLRDQYVSSLISQGYMAGEEYFAIEVSQVDLGIEGLQITKENALKTLIELADEDPEQIVISSYEQWAIELRLDDKGIPCYEIRTLKDRIIKEDLRVARDFTLEIAEPFYYDQKAILTILPLAYSLAQDKEIVDHSDTELLGEAFRFLEEELITTHPNYSDSLNGQRTKRSKRSKTVALAEAEAKGFSVIPGERT